MEQFDQTQLTVHEANKPPKGVVSFYDVADVVVSAVVTIMLVFTFLFRFAGVQGQSMEPTLYQGEWLFVSSAAYDEPAYKDVVIITQPNAFHEPIVKRVIATQGQTVDIDFLSGDVFVDGVKLEEPYISEPTTAREDIDFPLTVPEGKIFVMGDNRNASSDSRSTKVGMIDARYVLGKVQGRILPLGDWKVE